MKMHYSIRWMMAMAAGSWTTLASGQELRRALPALGAPEPAAAEMREARAEGGLKISLHAVKNEFEAGEAVKLTLTFENVSGENLRVFMPVPRLAEDNLEVRVNGPAVFRSGFQVRNMMAFLPGPASFPEIKPGEKKTFDFVVNGNPPIVQPGGIILGAVGEYHIQVVYTYQGAGAENIGDMIEGRLAPAADFEPWRGTVVSAPIAIRVNGTVNPLKKGPALRGALVEPMSGTPLEELPARSLRVPSQPVTDKDTGL